MSLPGLPPPPRVDAGYFKAHGAGNDYLVFPVGTDWSLRATSVRALCHRTRGAGADGLVVVAKGEGVPFDLWMFNPDGAAFERSGNGLRITAAYLSDAGLVGADPFTVRVGGAEVGMRVHARSDRDVYDVSADMGVVSFGGSAVGLDPGALDEHGGVPHPQLGSLLGVPVSVGNPHFVVFSERLDEARFQILGPYLTTHAAFAQGTNVQFASLSSGVLEILIWERGVGRTEASGTSACAAAAAAVQSGRLAPGEHTVHMEGGVFRVQVGADFTVRLRGPVQAVQRGRLTDGFLRSLSDLEEV